MLNSVIKIHFIGRRKGIFHFSNSKWFLENSRNGELSGIRKIPELQIENSIKNIEKRFNAKFIQNNTFTPNKSFNAFTNPKIPVITNDKLDCIQMFDWGLIPFWIRNKKDADNIKNKTLNVLYYKSTVYLINS